MTSPIPEFTIHRDVPQPIRDGTVLRVVVYLPRGTGPFPARRRRHSPASAPARPP